MPDIRDLALFDSCVTLGRLPLESVPECLTVGNILDVMDKYDIAEALVHSNEARLVLPRSRGNERLSETIAGMDRLHPVWALSPPAWPPGNWAEEMVERMRSSGVRVARLMMGHVPPLEWIWSPLLEALQARRVVCMLDFAPLRAPSTQCLPDDLTVDRLADLCGRFADLPMILSHHSGGLGISPVALHLLRRCRNVRIDITAVVDYWRRTASHLGPERVVFATGMPFYEPATFISNVQYDGTLDGDAKRLICGGNLRRLMEAVE